MKICICDDEKDFIHNFQLLLKQYSKKAQKVSINLTPLKMKMICYLIFILKMILTSYF